MINLTREQAEFLSVYLLNERPREHERDEAAKVASEIERQLITEAVFTPLERFDSCTCTHQFTSPQCPVHGHEWQRAEEYPPITPPEAA